MQREKTYRLSPQQAHLWALQTSAGPSPFRVQGLVSVEGELDRERMKEAIAQTVRRHEILRTTFTDAETPAEVLQIVWRYEQVVMDEMGEMTLEGAPVHEQEEKIAGLWDDCLQRPLNPEQLSLRVTLIALSPLKHAILVSLPALCADLATLENLAREIGRIYAACQDPESPAGAVMQYGDLAGWQNELLEAHELQIGRDHWSGFDPGSPALRSLPFANGASSQADFIVREFTSCVLSDQVLRLRRTAEKYGSSVRFVALACWAVLLGRSSGSEEIVMGVACDGRKYEELKYVVGPFSKVLPLLVSWREADTFANVLSSVEQAVTANYRWQECFSWRHSAPEPSSFWLSFEYVPEFRRWAAGDVTFKVEQHWACIDRFRMRLSCEEQDGSLLIRIFYDPHYLKRDEVSLLSERLHTILESAARNPETSISDLRITGPVERHTVLVEFNTSASHRVSDLCIHQLFEQQVERTPDCPAIMTGQAGLTYRDLNRRANQLAHHLRRHGVGVESRVAILMDRSLQMFVAVLAVLKAGAAYVPLDPRHPLERTSFVIADAAPALILTQQSLAEALPVSSVSVICVDANAEAIAGEDASNLSVLMAPECLVYLIYTSGSTGKPKGSMVSHRALVNHATQMIDLYGLGPDSRMLQFFPLSFDASAEDIFPSFLSGAILVCPPDFLAYSPSELLSFCERCEVTTLHLPVVLWHSLVEELSSGRLSLSPHVRTLSVGGESPSPKDLAAWNSATGGRVAFRNMYGPTEATITAAVYRQGVPALWPNDRIRVPMGRPLANVSIYLLDAEMEPVPVAVPGEIYIGGLAPARGYVNQPGLTADRFVPDPFSGLPGARLYKTGDLGRFLINGEIEFLGRIDRQVKIRGFRIELEEIERILVRHPAIEDAAVAVHEDGIGGRRLAAYVTLRSNQSATAKQMRNHLREHVPDYMLPSWFVVLNSLPLSSAGKIDRTALPAPTNETLGPEQEYVAPRNPTEEIVAAIFAEVLQRDQVGILDNFFESGGHSLLAIQLAGRLRETFQVEVSLRRIFDDPTAAGVAAALLEEESERLRVERTAELMVKLASVSDDQAESVLEQAVGPVSREQL